MVGLNALFMCLLNTPSARRPSINDENIRSRGSVRLVGCAVPFVLLFVAFLVRTLCKEGYAYDPAS